ncbi:uncharacterized protein LY79DRAFT_155236 [Colletotrichum navitas]|uniref:Uncharacterized protein n=1 Tax=Colletotrichum navitas TaxID=681940 RepID=A0AAD8Q2R0_9PEZI|nr:uncharacterized protein LY79DRAFT_155236 [Colletotrichum navitas]KAK1594385.1 hypothetical protein LY79DRAFT_155236 [Colletotrichum navitas]
MWSSPFGACPPVGDRISGLTSTFQRDGCLVYSFLFSPLPHEGDYCSGGTPPDKSTIVGILSEAERTEIEADLCAVLLCRACSHIPDRCFVLQQTQTPRPVPEPKKGVRVPTAHYAVHHPTPSEQVCVCMCPWCIPGAGADPHKVQCSWQHRALPCPTLFRSGTQPLSMSYV